MEHVHHAHHPHHARQPSLNRTAWSATLHCLAGCAIGEVLGMVIGTALGWGNGATIALAVALAFLFGFALTLLPLVKATGFNTAVKLALASDTASITVMEVVDNAIMLVIRGRWMPVCTHCSFGAASLSHSPSPLSRHSRSIAG